MEDVFHILKMYLLLNGMLVFMVHMERERFMKLNKGSISDKIYYYLLFPSVMLVRFTHKHNKVINNFIEERAYLLLWTMIISSIIITIVLKMIK